MRVDLLGPIRVTDEGEDIELRGAKQRSLAGVLALHRASPVAADRLIELLWRDDEPVNPQNALQAQVKNLRRAIGADRVVTVGAGYALQYDVDGSDVATFERFVADGRSAAEAGDHASATARFAASLALWRGPALVDFLYDDWARGEIARLEELRAAAIDARIDADLALGRAAELIGEIEALLAEDRLREHRWAQLMLALYRSGRQADALRAFAQARETLVEELGIEPGPELTELEQRILTHDVAPAAPRATLALDLTRPTLPTPLTRFIGRERELAEVTAAVRSAGTRLVTLIGPGGAGKTRLALEAARDVERGGDHEAFFASLEDVSDPDAVASEVAAAVGLRRDGAGGGAVDLTNAVASLLLRRPTLLVLDNCEHVIAEAARLAQRLLESCPDLTVLATSREAIGVPGEQILPVGPLDPADAAQLFVDRAQAVRADPDMDAASPSVSVICERLDGLPLAVELAAARTKALPVNQIADRLAQRFRLLTGGSRTAVPRQQTLRAVVDWSYDLLFDDEKELFARLSVFAGGWTLDAAERVCADDVLPADSVLDLLANLVDKSLVVAESLGGELRYRMLQTLAEYAQERLADRDGAARFRDSHARWFCDLAHGAEAGLTSPEAPEWRRRLDLDLDNLRAALDWLCESGQGVDAITLATDVALLWWLRGDWSEGLRWAEQAAGAGDAPENLRAVNDAWAAFYRANQGDAPAETVAACRGAVARLDALDDTRRSATAHVLLATILSRQRDAGLLEAATRAVEVAAADGDPWFHGVAHALLALHHVRLGELDEATAAAGRSVDLLQSVGDRSVVFEARSVLVTVAQLGGRLDEAEDLVRDMAEAACDASIRHYEQWCCTRLGFIRTARGDLRGGEELHRSALAIGADPWADAHAHLGLAVCARRCGDLDTARHHCDRALAVHERVGASIEQAYVHLLRAWTELDGGQLDDARRLADHARTVVPAPGAPSVDAMAAEVHAAIAAIEGDDSGARRLLSKATELAPVVGHAAWWLTRPDVAAVSERVGAAPA